MSLEILIVADPEEAEDGEVEVRLLARRRAEEDPVEDSRLFAAGDRAAIARCVAGWLERNQDALGDPDRRTCRRCSRIRSAREEGESRRPFICGGCRRRAERTGTPSTGAGNGVEARFLGTSNAFGAGGRRHASIFLRARGARRGVLLDAGPGCAGALRGEGLAADDVAAVILSHFHGDHFGGLTFLELDGLRTGRSEPLLVVAPPGARERLAALRTCLYPGFRTPFPERIVEALPGETKSLPVSAGSGSATPFPADHQPRGWAFGWTVRLGGRTIVYSGDSTLTARILEESEGADLLVHECTSVAPLPGHTSVQDLAEAAPRIRARRTLLVHTGEAVSNAPDPPFDLAHDGLRVVV